MASWQSWYARYTSKTIFGEGSSWPSPEYLKQGAGEFLQWITHVSRAVFSKDRLIINDPLVACWKENGWQLPLKYLPSVANVAAGYQSFFKYNRPQPSPDPLAWKVSYQWLDKHFRPHMGGADILPMDFVLREMNMSTSPGYPWNMSYPTKTEFLADETMSKVLADYHEVIASCYPCGVEPIWTCSVKGAEMRPIEKILDNKLRTFTASPIEHSVSGNIYCLDMNSKFYRSANRTWSFVGQSKFNGGWDRLGQGLNQHPNIYSLDGKNFDSSLFAAALWDQCKLRYSYLKPQYRTQAAWNALRNLYAAIIYAVCVLDLGDLIRKFTGNPSGCINTIVDNTMILIRFMFYAWLRLSEPFRRKMGNNMHNAEKPMSDPDFYQTTGDEEFYDYTDMMSNVFMKGNGDDDAFSVSDACNTWFNARAIARVWEEELGLITTADSLDPVVLTFIRFLSQGFVMISGMHMPSPEPEKVLASLYVGSKLDDIRWHLLRANALRTDSFMNAECRLKIETFINYLHHHYSDQLVGSVNGLTMDEINAVWKSDEDLMTLYTGWESTSSELKPHARLVSINDVDTYACNTGSTFMPYYKPIPQTILCHAVLRAISLFSHQHRQENGEEIRSIGQFARAAGRGLRPGATVADRLMAQVAGLGLVGFPAAVLASDTTFVNPELTERQRRDGFKHHTELMGQDPVSVMPELEGPHNMSIKDRVAYMEKVQAQINGNNGSATNTDDHPKKHTPGKKTEKKEEKKIVAAVAAKVIRAEHKSAPKQKWQAKPKIHLDKKTSTPRVEKIAVAELVKDAITLEMARSMLKRCIRKPWSQPMPPLGAVVGPVIPLHGRYAENIALSLYGSFNNFLIVQNPSFKASVSLYKSLNGAAFALIGSFDVDNLTAIVAEATYARIGLAAVSVTVKTPPNATVVAPSLYVGSIPPGTAVGGIVAATFINQNGTRFVPGKTATVVFKPTDITTATNFSSLPISTGPQVIESSPAILINLYNASSDTINLSTVVHGEGKQTFGQDKYGTAKHDCVSYTPTHLYEGLPTGLIANKRAPDLMGALNMNMNGPQSMLTTKTGGPVAPKQPPENRHNPYDPEYPDGDAPDWNGLLMAKHYTEGRMFPIHLTNGMDVVYHEEELRHHMKDKEFVNILPMENVEWFILNYGPPNIPPKIIEPKSFIKQEEKHIERSVVHQSFSSDEDAIHVEPEISSSTMDLAHALRGLVSKTPHVGRRNE